MKWSDKDIDKLFRDAAEKHSIAYDASYWNEFEKDLPFTGNEWSDQEIDKLFRRAANNYMIPYSSAYWNEFELSMPGVEPGWSDAEIDGLFRSESRNQNFEYKDAYWQEFEASLPQERRRDVVWFFFAFTFISILGAMLMNNRHLGSDQINTAKLEQNPTENAGVKKEVDDQTLNNAESTEVPVNAGISEAVSASDEQVLQPENQSAVVSPEASGENVGVSGSEPTAGEPVNEQLVNETTDQPGEISSVTPEIAGQDDKESGNVVNRDELNVDPLDPRSLIFATSEPVFQQVNYPKVSRKPLFSFYAQGVGGLSQSLITPSERLSYYYGLGVGTRMLYRNFSINTGLNVIVSQHEDLELSRSAKVYGYGSTLYKYNLDYEHLYMLEGDFSVSYNFKRSSFKLGVRPSYLLSTRVRIEQSDLKTEQDVVSNSDSRLNYGFNEGMKKFGIKPTLGYSYLLPRNGFELGVNIGVQLMPMVNEEYINGVNNKLPIDGQVYIRKYLHLKR